MCTVTVTVDDVNEPPTPNKTHTFWIRENAQKGTLVGYPILSGDPDIYDTHDYIITSWSSDDETYSNTDSAWHLPFMIQEGTGQMYLQNTSALPTSGVDKIFSFNIIVKDAEDLQSTCTVNITIVNVNDPPVVEDQSFLLPENSNEGYIVGTISALDINSGDVLSYIFSQAFPPSGMHTFVLSETTGQITVSNIESNNVTIDHESLTNYSFLVSVNDQHLTYPMYDSAIVTITVTDVNEYPNIVGRAII